MDQVHDLLPSSDIGLGPLGSINPQSGFSNIQGALETFLFTTIMCTIVFATMMLTLMVVPYIERKFIARLMDRLGARQHLHHRLRPLPRVAPQAPTDEIARRLEISLLQLACRLCKHTA